MGWGGGWSGGRGRRRRGDVRRALLSALTDGPAHGYELMGRLEERSGGLWRPSPGSVYPTLQLLEDEGLVRSSQVDTTRVYELTDAGREKAAEGPGPGPWSPPGEEEAGLRDLFHGVAQLAQAAKQVARTARPEQVERAGAIVSKARKELYQLLAED
jgi:DNA-binding PadR family transcriptional regulator